MKFANGTKTLSLLTILLIVSILYFLPGLFSPRDFWIEDEARYAEVVREMMTENEWAVPRLNGHYYPDKPVLYFWMVIVSSTVFGTITPFTFLLITVLTAIGSIVSLYYFGRYLFDEFTGFLSALVLTSTFLFIISAQIARMDMLFTLFIILALFSFYHAYRSREPNYYTLFYLLCGLAVFSKGPLGFIFPFLPATIFLLYKKELKELKTFLLNKGFVLMFLMLFAWVSIVIYTGHHDYIKIIIVEQILGRAVNSFIHKEPIYYFLIVFPLVFYPWTIYLPRALSHFYSEEKDLFEFLTIWFLSGFIVISLISGKLFIYLLPLFPPVALMVGKFFRDVLKENNLFEYNLRTEGIVGSVIFGLALVAFPIALGHFLPEETDFFMPLILLFVPILFATIYFTIKRQGAATERSYRSGDQTEKKLGCNSIKALFILSYAGMFLFSAFIFGYAGSHISQYVSSRVPSEKIAEMSEKGYEITSYNVTRGIFNFYAGKLIKELTFDDLEMALASDKKVLSIFQEQEFKKLDDSVTKKIIIIGRYDLLYEKYLLVANSPLL